jgi:hypothetical protein
LLLALGPGLNGLLAHKAEFLEDALFSLISFGGIAGSIFDNVEERLKLGLEFRVALQALKEIFRRSRGQRAILRWEIASELEPGRSVDVFDVDSSHIIFETEHGLKRVCLACVSGSLKEQIKRQLW